MAQSVERENVSVRELRANLASYLKQAEAGTRIAIVSHGHVVAELHPPSAPPEPVCTFGAMTGQIWTAPGWDDPDSQLIDLMLNSPIFPEDDAA